MNDVKLQEGHPVDENLRPIKVGGKSTAIETAQHGNGARVNGDLEVTGNIKGNIKDVELDLTKINSTNLIIDDSGNAINLQPNNQDVFNFEYDGFKMKYYGDTDDYIEFQILNGGNCYIRTVADPDNDTANLNIQPEGAIYLQPAGDHGVVVSPDIRTSSGNLNATLKVEETLALGNGVATVDDTTPSPSAAWIPTQSYTDVVQTSTDGSGSGLKCDIATDGSGNPTFTIVTDAPSGGYGYAVDEEIVFTDPGATSSTATLVVASVTSPADGDDVHYGIWYKQTQTQTSGWNTVYLMYLTGGAGKIFHIDNNANLTLSDDRKIIFGDAGEYIVGDGTDLSIVSSGDIALDSNGDIDISSNDGNFIMRKGNDEFSPANSAYAGMILGYTRIQNDGTDNLDNVITINTSSMTVLQTEDGTDLSIQFIVPPSGNVEIQCSFWLNASSKGAKFSLSTASSYAELGISHTYDADNTVYIDESDHAVHTISFAVTGLVAGTDTTYYLAGLASGGMYINHGRLRSTGNHFPPIILRAIALPATIVTGE